MADDERIEELQLQVTQLQDKLESMTTGSRQVSELTAEEMETFAKVRDVLSTNFDDWGCGINECFRCVRVCQVCTVCDVRCDVLCFCRPCDVECSCGPCGVGGLRSGAVSRFGQLGG